MARYLRRNRTEIGVAIKYTLFLTNVVFWLCGLALTFVGTYALIEKKKVVRDAIDFFFDPSSLITLIGSVSIVVSFFGCWGALRENTCLLKLYFHTLWILFFGEIVLICLVLIFYFMPQIRNQMHLFPEKEFHKAIVKYRDDADMQNMIDSMQKSLKCCGLSDDDDGYLDWNDNEYFNCTDSNPSSSRCSVPPSCCKMKPGDVINVMCGADALKADDPVGIPK